MRISFKWLREFVDLPDDAAVVGERLTRAGLTLDALESVGTDTILELDVTSNRGDCLSHLGVAREAAALFETSVRMPETALPDPSETDGLSVRIEDPALCGRYTARLIRGVRVGDSPDWIAKRLEASGIRPVNNVADITNYVLLELGHPLHAFDLDRLDSGEILVRNAQAGEALETLDGIARPLDPKMLVITNGKEPIALAGIMGGQSSEISAGTTNVLIESAWFDPLTIRRAARALSLTTEASYRFERGADIEMAATASDRVTRLVTDLAGGVAGPLRDVYPSPPRPEAVRLRRDRIAGHLGIHIPDEEVLSILEGLGFLVRADGSGWKVTAPSYRHDISREEDLLEELARQRGYDRIPATLPTWSGDGRALPWQAEERTARDTLRGLGYSETCTLVFSQRETEKLFRPEDEPIELRNPLSEDEPVLRTSLVPDILRSVRWNLNRGIRDLRLYEIGKVYRAGGESRQLVLAITGPASPPNVHVPPRDSGFYDLKGDVTALIDPFEVEARAWEPTAPDYYHPGRSARLGPDVVLGEIHDRIAAEFRIRQKVYVAEIEIERLYEAGVRKVAVVPIPKYPALRRDLSLLVERTVDFSDIAAAIEEASIPELVAVEPFDRLERGPFPESCYSLAIALEYQSPDRTLTDAEVEAYGGRILSRLEAIGAKLRS